MSAKLLLGKPCADSIYENICNILAGKSVKLVTVGFDEERWNQYSNSLYKSAAKLGIECEQIWLELGISPDDFCRAVRELSADTSVAGVILQQPLPKEYAHAVNFVSVDKDVDCLNPLSIAKLYLGEDGFRPATPLAVLRLLDYYGIDLQGKNVVIIGRGAAVGKPLALMALQRNATVTVCHTKTRNLSTVCRQSDVLISACGVAGLVTADFVTDSTVVIDVGLSFVNGKTCGDVASEVYDKCSAVSPVPGGIGPVTRAVLFENLLNTIK
ncbi:MAG: bifunctional 5,10-methylenetetrahydrofolate dehydrogenase/5,10-methenyltetrahydrofolate cyclohydrolase [Clostridiales bacterium]|nr:bifunctional 5,10-methylenetetrahydrofolate dehydrogenase/5,10-methenyltetrahydrofolate cyclohydrolase [Clostridiales bacterium]